MSAARLFPLDAGLTGLRLSADEYLALGETPERYELIDGVVVMSPSPTPRHQKTVLALLRQMDPHTERVGGELIQEVDVRLAPGLVYRPDLVYYAPGRLAELPRRLETAPDLVVEVLSPGSKALDLITKRGDYERFGVGEYWVVNPDNGEVRCWSRATDRTTLVENQIAGDRLPSATIPGFVLNLAPLRRPVRP